MVSDHCQLDYLFLSSKTLMSYSLALLINSHIEFVSVESSLATSGTELKFLGIKNLVIFFNNWCSEFWDFQGSIKI